jgi:small subunit ribosomal protein S21
MEYRRAAVTGTLKGSIPIRVFGGERHLVKIVLRERESVPEAVRRFRKLIERTGLKRELRRRERYEKPSDVKRKAKARAIRRAKKAT